MPKRSAPTPPPDGGKRSKKKEDGSGSGGSSGSEAEAGHRKRARTQRVMSLPENSKSSEIPADAAAAAAAGPAAAAAPAPSPSPSPGAGAHKMMSTRSGLDPAALTGAAREEQLRALLEHRRLLLDRIGRCRAAAARRLRDPQSPLAPGAPVALPPEPSLEEEAAQWKAKAQRAISASRRSSRADGAAGPPLASTVSLRRGGSVGKKMAAAVSTLTKPGSIGGWVSDSSDGASPTPIFGSSSGKKAKGGPLHPSAPGAPGGKHAAAALAAAALASSRSGASAASGGKETKSGKSGKSGKRAKTTGSPAPGGIITKLKKSSKSKKDRGGTGVAGAGAGMTLAVGGPYGVKSSGKSSSGKSSSRSGSKSSKSSAAVTQSRIPRVGSAGGPSIGTTGKAAVAQQKQHAAALLERYASNPKVVCQPARLLREQREAVREQLERLITRRKERESKLMAAGTPSSAGATEPAASRGGTGEAAGEAAAGELTSRPVSSPTSVASKSSVLADLVRSRPHFKTYALAQQPPGPAGQSSSSGTAAAAGAGAGAAAGAAATAAAQLQPLPSAKVTQPFRPDSRQPSEASRPPPRRKTQWDYVLDEMRWAATDFEAERRWKGAVGRTLGSAVLAFHASPIGKGSSPLKKGLKMGGGSSANKKHGSSAVGSARKKPRTPASSSTGSKRPRSASTPQSLDSEQDEDYEPTDFDIDQARTLAKGLSVLVNGHWDMAMKDLSESGAASHVGMPGERKDLLPSDLNSLYGVHSRYREAVKSIDGLLQPEEREPEADASYSSGGKSFATTDDDEAAAPSFDMVTERVESALERASLLGTMPAKKGRPVEASDCNIDLQPSQVDAIHFVEAVWEDGASGDEAPTSGVILSGKIASGKTMAVGAALWRQSEEGPQILFCHSTRLVSLRVPTCELFITSDRGVLHFSLLSIHSTI